MHIEHHEPPRQFGVGYRDIVLSHSASIMLGPDEMVTFVDGNGGEYDVTRKDWGYYATPSLGRRLRSFGLRAALMRNVETRQCFVVLVEESKQDQWRSYMRDERQELVMWLDDEERLASLPAEEREA